jgi:hypothetical protein
MDAKAIGCVLAKHETPVVRDSFEGASPTGRAKSKKGKPAFMALPLRARADHELTALQLRVLGCISWHDRFSLNKGSRGCYARNALMAQEVDCTITSLSRAISKLVKRGYIVRDHAGAPGTRHLTVYRVLHEDASIVQRDKGRLPKEATDETPSNDRVAGKSDQRFARRVRGNAKNPPSAATQETSLREERDSLENAGTDTSKEPTRARRDSSNSAMGPIADGNDDWVRRSLLELLATLRKIEAGKKNGKRDDAANLTADIFRFPESQTRMFDSMLRAGSEATSSSSSSRRRRRRASLPPY